MSRGIVKIAEICGVSIATVSRVLNNSGPVKESTRARILQIAQELNYKPNSNARSLSRKRTDTIGVILPELVDEFFMGVIQGINEVANRHQRYIMLSSSHSQRDELETMLEFMNSGRVDGVILMAPALHHTMKTILKSNTRPLVLLNCRPGIPGVVSINFDNFQGAKVATEHLIQHGYQKIAMITGPEINNDARERLRGFQSALKENNINLPESFIVPGEFNIESGYYGFMRLMSLPEKPRAIFAANDMMVLGAYEAAKSLKLRIPDDIAIAGFDDIFLGRLLNPRLTTVHAPIVEMGRAAMRQMLKMVDQKWRPEEEYTIHLSTGLVIGGSCGCKNNNGNHFF